MILAVDVGNTNIVVGCIDDGKILFSSRLTTDSDRTDFEIATIIKSIISLNKLHSKDFEGAIISSVVPPINDALKTAIELVIGKKPYMINGTEGLKVAIDDPKQIGDDLLIGAIAALKKFKPPIAMVDMGTATTIFVIDKNSAFIGGSILPGIRVSQNALSKSTSLLPSISLEAPKSVIGKNTIDAMKSGAVFGNVSMLDGMLDKIEEELGENVTTVATGGLSKYIIPLCKHKILYEENLLLDGLWLVYKKQKLQNQ